jgi:hypothetical protein
VFINLIVDAADAIADRVAATGECDRIGIRTRAVDDEADSTSDQGTTFVIRLASGGLRETEPSAQSMP